MYKDVKSFISKKNVIHYYEQFLNIEDTNSIFFCVNKSNELVQINAKNNYDSLV